MLKVKVDGYKEAKAILDELPNNMQKKMLISALRGSAKPMLKSARSKVPSKTGTLRKRLKIVRFRDRKAPKSEVSVAVKPVYDRTKKKGEINQYYGRFIHEGTSDPRMSKKGKVLTFENKSGKRIFIKSVKGLSPNPFLGQAYSENIEKTVSAFGGELAKSIEKFVSKKFKKITK